MSRLLDTDGMLLGHGRSFAAPRIIRATESPTVGLVATPRQIVVDE
jgi:hypothetical protein